MIRDLTNQRFGRLTAIYLIKKRTDRIRVIWLCRCDCGNLIYVRSSNLISGNTKSCGCLYKGINITHGDTADGKISPPYNTWLCVFQRCYNKNKSNYKWYGGKGITVCNEWHNYPIFKKWALANGWKPGLTIDRIDSEGNYTPDNCQWITNSENVRKSRIG